MILFSGGVANASLGAGTRLIAQTLVDLDEVETVDALVATLFPSYHDVCEHLTFCFFGTNLLQNSGDAGFLVHDGLEQPLTVST